MIAEDEDEAIEAKFGWAPGDVALDLADVRAGRPDDHPDPDGGPLREPRRSDDEG